VCDVWMICQLLFLVEFESYSSWRAITSFRLDMRKIVKIGGGLVRSEGFVGVWEILLWMHWSILSHCKYLRVCEIWVNRCTEQKLFLPPGERSWAVGIDDKLYRRWHKKTAGCANRLVIHRMPPQFPELGMCLTFRNDAFSQRHIVMTFIVQFIYYFLSFLGSYCCLYDEIKFYFV